MSVPYAVAAASPRRAIEARAPEVVMPFIDHARGHAVHEVASLHAASLRVSALLGCADSGDAGADVTRAGPRYWLPMRTLLREEADLLAIDGEDCLWGGVVPHAFVGTKLVSHRLWPGGSGAPEGWRDVPGVDDCTLPGWSVFSRGDALAACAALLEDGPVRAKSPYARGGNDQARFADLREARDWLDSGASIGIEHGLVLERDIVETVTYGVGSARIGRHAIAYYGTQRAVRDRAGRLVYGGTRLTAFRGGLRELCATLPHGEAREAVDMAMRFDRAVRATYAVLASRCNYDVIVGHERDGRRRCGVLEQSWRFGGASMAELLALERFAQDPARHWLVAETAESYDDLEPPPDSVVVWPGDAGSPCKYARIVDDGY